MILIEGDKLYKSLNTNMHLNVDELPRTIQYNGIVSHVTLLNLKDCIAMSTQNYSLLQIPFENNMFDNSESLVLMFIAGFTIAIFQLQHNVYYLFDSHNRDGRGLFTADGKSCLLKFPNVSNIEKYIQHAYLELRGNAFEYFQIQFVEINVPCELPTILTREYRNLVARESYTTHVQVKKCHQYEKTKDSIKSHKNRDNFKKRYQNNKEKIKEHYQKNKNKIKKQYQKNKERIKEQKKKDNVQMFKNQIKEGPFYICVSCNRCLYRRSVFKFSVFSSCTLL